jgi:hypothetical protein
VKRLILSLGATLPALFLIAGAQAQTCGFDVCVGDSWQAAYAGAAYGEEVTLEPGAHPAQSLYFVSGRASEVDEPNVVFQGGPGVSVGNITAYGIRHVTFSGINAGDVVFECEDTGIPVEARGQHPIDVAVIDSKLRTTRSENASDLLIARNEIGPSSTVNKVNASADDLGGNCTDEPPTGIVYEDNDIHNFRESSAASHMECLFVEGVQGLTIRRNIFRACSVFDLFFKRQGAAGSFGMSNILIENNMLGHPVASAFRTAGSTAISFSGAAGANYSNLTVRNNSVNAQILLRDDLGVTFTNTLIEGNLALQHSGDCFLAGVTMRYNGWLNPGQACAADLGDNQLSGWIDVETQAELDSPTSDPTIDYHLSAGAWAIDRSPAGPVEDFDAQARPLGPAFDVGADEWTPPLDVSPPSAPSALAISDPQSSSVLLSWQASSDDMGVAGYRVYLDAALVADTATLSALVLGLAAEQHALEVEAYDAAGNVSPRALLIVYRTWRI